MSAKDLPANLPDPSLLTTRSDAQTQLEARIEDGEKILKLPVSSWETFKHAKNEYKIWNDYNDVLLRKIFSNEKVQAQYSPLISFGVVALDRDLGRDVNELWDDVKNKIQKLRSIVSRLSLYDELVPATPPRVQNAPPSTSNKVFIVHGHDDLIKEQTARFMESLGLKPVILHEQASRGQTIIEKIESNSDVDFAVVLLTADDVGAAKTTADQLKDRARQNVILELGYFVAKLKRSRVAALHKPQVELPSDYAGVVYISIDPHGAWKLSLAKELKEVFTYIDLNKVI